MSILIQGMDMPKGNSTINVLIYADGTVYTGHVNDSQYSAVSVPTSHGRLIDVDAVNKAMDERIEKLKDDKSIYEASCVATALDMFAPTVIEAEGET